MKIKSKWPGVVFSVLMALVVAVGLALVIAPAGPPAEAGDLIWTNVEGVPPYGLPPGAGALIDVAVTGNYVYVLCDRGDEDADGALNEDPVNGIDDDADGLVDEDPGVWVYRSDDGGYSWMAPTSVVPGFPFETGIDIEVSPNHAQDGCVMVETYDPFVTGTGWVWVSTDRGATWRNWWTAAIPGVPTCLGISMNFDARSSGGMVVAGGLWNGFNCTWYTNWLGPWAGPVLVWNPIASTTAADCLALKCPPTNALAVVTVQTNLVAGLPTHTFGAVASSVTVGFPALIAVPGAGLPWTDIIHFGFVTNADIALADDYDPIVTLPKPNAPMEFFVGDYDITRTPFNIWDTGLALVPTWGSTWWFNPSAGIWQNLMTAIVPVSQWPTASLVVDGLHTRATLIAGCAYLPIVHKCDVRSLSWSLGIYIEGNGGAMGTVSTNLGVVMDYIGVGSQVHAITSQLPSVEGAVAWAVGIPAWPPVTAAGDLACLSISSNFGDSWTDTALTSEDFRTIIADMAWTDCMTGFIVCDTGVVLTQSPNILAPTLVQSTFKTWDRGISWKRVDRWQGVQIISVAPDGTVCLLNTNPTATKVLRSTDAGESFLPTVVDPVTLPTIQMTALACGSSDDIFVGSWMGHIYVTHDGGASWTDLGQIAAAIDSLAVPDNYDTVQHVLAGVWSLVGNRLEIMLSDDDGASWSQVGSSTENTAWGPGGPFLGGHIEGKFSPTYDGDRDRIVYAGTALAARDDMYRYDLAAAGWTRMGISTILGVPSIPVTNFDLVHYPGVNSTLGRDNILYTTLIVGGMVWSTFDPDLVSEVWPFTALWRIDVAGPVLWDPTSIWALTWGTPGGTILPNPMDALAASSVCLFAVDSASAATPPDRVRHIAETTAYLTPPVLYSPTDQGTVPSNNCATGEPVELHWYPVIGATFYEVYVCTDINNILTGIPGWNPVVIGPLVTEASIPVCTLEDGQIYFWRVRADASTAFGDHTGPWSDWFNFTVEAVEIHVGVQLISPTSGELNVPVRPLYRWGQAEDATDYHLQVDDDPAFGSPIIDETFDAPQQTYQPATALAWDSTYSWRVQASGGTGITAWTTPWVASNFTTMPEWMAPAPTATPAWVWIAIAIGALLVIAVIALILRTRPAGR